MLWKNWKTISKGDYLYAKLPNHPKANSRGYVLEHRVIMENKLNRILGYNDVVHHKNKKIRDNRVENLELIQRGEHTRNHNFEKGIFMVVIKCPFCLKIFERRKGHTTLIKKKAKLNFCCRSCSGKFYHLNEKEQKLRSNKHIINTYRKSHVA